MMMISRLSLKTNSRSRQTSNANICRIRLNIVDDVNCKCNRAIKPKEEKYIYKAQEWSYTTAHARALYSHTDIDLLRLIESLQLSARFHFMLHRFVRMIELVSDT